MIFKHPGIDIQIWRYFYRGKHTDFTCPDNILPAQHMDMNEKLF